MTLNALEIPPPDTMVNLARSFAGEAVTTLVNLMRTAKSEQVQLSAAKEIFRGKPADTHVGPVGFEDA